jgi:hypothetical protein
VAAQHCDFVAQYQDLGVLGGIGASQERQLAQHPDQRQVGKSEGHSG